MLCRVLGQRWGRMIGGKGLGLATIPQNPLLVSSTLETTDVIDANTMSVQVEELSAEEIAMGESRRSKDGYEVREEDIKKFQEDGWVVLPGVLSGEECDALEAVYDQFLAGAIPVEGHDFGDMSQPRWVAREDWRIVNVMRPRHYFPRLQGGVYEKRGLSISEQLARGLGQDLDLVLEYDQLLDKLPGKREAVFHFHQDLGFWPVPLEHRFGSEPLPLSTFTLSLSLDATDVENGCLRFVRGTHSKRLRRHEPLANVLRRARGEPLLDGEAARQEAGGICAGLQPGDQIVYVHVPRGGVSIHDHRVLHGSSGNASTRHRRNYVVAYRDRRIVQFERRIGFAHSYNDQVGWANFREKGAKAGMEEALEQE